MGEHRQFARTPVVEELFCYIGGARFDASSMDISIGGMRILTHDSAKIPIGVTIGLVLQGSAYPTTFLFGAVVRHIEGDKPGLGLEWSKAVSVGEAQHLKQFLLKWFGFSAPPIQQEVFGEHGRVRNVFTFPFAIKNRSASTARPVAQPDVPPVRPEPVNGGDVEEKPAISLDIGADTDDSWETLDVDDQHFSANSDAVETAGTVQGDPEGAKPFDTVETRKTPSEITERFGSLRHSSKSGSITQMVERDQAEVACLLPAEIKVGSATLDVTLTRIGLSSGRVESPFMPIDQDRLIDLTFKIASRNGHLPVVCRCRLQKVLPGSPGGMILSFGKVEEGDSPGVLTRYIKWLMYRAISKS